MLIEIDCKDLNNINYTDNFVKTNEFNLKKENNEIEENNNRLSFDDECKIRKKILGIKNYILETNKNKFKLNNFISNDNVLFLKLLELPYYILSFLKDEINEIEELKTVTDKSVRMDID